MTLTRKKTNRRVSPHDRKRIGQHHSRSGHYLKSYWPYIPVFAVLLLGMFFNSLLARQNHSVLGYATDIQAQTMLAETNGERTSHRESALQLNTQLTKAAQTKANDMARRGYWSHVTPDGKQPWTFIESSGYQYQAAGENLAYGFGTSDQVIRAWMLSTEHRANVLNPNYQDVGFATANTTDYHGLGPQTIVVALYAEPVGMINKDDTPVPDVLGVGTQTVSRLELFSAANWLEMAIAAVAGGALVLFFTRHAFAWHRVLNQGEEFLIRHPFFDMFLMGSAVLVFLLSHAAGAIL